MSVLEIRPFRRDDRDQLTALVNAHARAVLPGVSTSVNGVLSALEREPGEYVVDPWVTARTTLVARRRDRLVAAVHLHRYAAREEVGGDYRDAAELRWLLCLPEDREAGHAVGDAAVRAAFSDGARVLHADGALPAPGCYGIPDAWPHVATVLTGLGFAPGERVETLHVAEVAELRDLPEAGRRVDGVGTRRSVGTCGVRFSAEMEGRVVGYVEIDSPHDDGARLARADGWADIGNLEIDPGHRRQGVATLLLGAAARWLDLGGVERLLAYSADLPEEAGLAALLDATGFVAVTRTTRGWTRRPDRDG